MKELILLESLINNVALTNLQRQEALSHLVAVQKQMSEMKQRLKDGKTSEHISETDG